MKTKICTGECRLEKPISEFNKSKKGKFGVESCCKSCKKVYRDINKIRFSLKDKVKYQKNKQKIKLRSKTNYENNKNNLDFKQKRKDYRDQNKEKRIQYDKQRYEENKVKIKERVKKYRLNNKESINNYFVNRRNSDINFKITSNLRIRLWKVLKGINKSKRTLELLGCSIEFLKIHLEKQFTKGMNWNNYGLWHIDHKLPCISFDLSDSGQQKECFNYINLQPLWAIDNLIKGSKI